MDVFTCEGCGAELTAPLSRVPFPAYAGSYYGNGLTMPVLMEPGTYAVDEGPAREARSIVIAPGDAVGTDLIQRAEPGACCGIYGRYGPNVTCAGCRRKVATRVDDCSLWQATWLEPDAVRLLPAGPARPVADWAELTAWWCATEPWDRQGWWEPRWESEAAVTLAHVVAAADGSPVTVPDGPLADTFRVLLDQALPPGSPPKRLALLGPGLLLPDPLPDIAVVPRHPQTGEPWTPPPGVAAAPLDVGYWTHLARFRDRLLRPVTGGLPPGVERDDPLPLHPCYDRHFAWGTYRKVLARLRPAPGGEGASTHRPEAAVGGP
ncbi:hypothetical protein GCM10018790_70440 [Kitasatospora xanthocidica]|uniref:hypothetical protein n=1 Tax=Kitasatospora xanthocidica TaxID=83382 RepID=UPI001679FCB0|nr:hypothetical protein [Kitasatospora xanthocidica]GHF82644.1 hypothetical protein GCM10018790_70440 [Kitasatospora xanthocidica]